MQRVEHPEIPPARQLTAQVIVVGGGLAGVSAAIAAARNGAEVILVHERPVLGGNSSSEIRVGPSGATQNGYHRDARETGIIEEIFLETRSRAYGPRQVNGNHYPMWDVVLEETVRAAPRITLLLNTRVIGIETTADDRDGYATRITGVSAVQQGTEATFDISGDVFVDSTGDGFVAIQAGAPYRYGREASSEFNESWAPDEEDALVLGSTIMFAARDMGRPIPFTPPAWAASFPDEDSLPYRSHEQLDSGYWWIEWGARNDTIADNDTIRRELQAAVFGVWDHIKNHCTVPGVRERASTWAIDWIGHLPGKRESRRFEGDHILTEADVSNGIHEVPADVVAFGGWPVDLHAIDGIYAPEPPCTQPPLPDRYGIPLRALYSRTVSNLFLAGRNISQSHVAHASTRVMKTCSVIGEGVGTTAARAAAWNKTPRQIAGDSALLDDVQQRIIRGGAYLPKVRNTDSADLLRLPGVTVAASSEAILRIDLDPEPDQAWEIYGLTDIEPKILASHLEKHPGGEAISLENEVAQAVVISSSRLDAIALRLRNHGDRTVEATIRIRQATTLRDFGDRDPGEHVLAALHADVPPGDSTVEFRPDSPIACEPGAPISIHPLPDPALSWLLTIQEPPGTQAGKWDADLGYWRWTHGTFGIELTPESTPYRASNVLSGQTRPEAGANLWISDPHASLPQSLEMSWPQPVTLNHLEVTFDSQLSGWIWEGAFPLVVRDYQVEAKDPETETWHLCSSVAGNVHRRRTHRFDRVTTSDLRITITATNGGRTARMFEVRAYNANE